ncbi:putative ABC transporter ATP-binding protein YxlF [Lacunisphaera limnophila]|uniref:Putative ABC transporter ATP-binding protein YxlF n=1 Tax=Lacunisphaera limnophila TaxID=1838286 RepID=A0A1D8AQZ2_9BACT|nr:ABC transporter ATP-binding protein [Lacunisphaera limnophila]AOS43094.1 putative ABC transporter ATP-binding protein YxlF [Lacunisphaera limnophila]
MADIPDNTIEVSNLVKTYGSLTAVNNLSFTVKRGEIVGLLGPNGAGKSTTMRILTGYLPANAGSVRICGLPVASHPEATRRHIGYMPENNPLPEDLRVSEYLWFRGRLKEMPRAKLRARIDEVLELCDLKRNRHRILGRLSKGNRQRVGIAEAILAEPAVIIMDEPTIGLDPHQIIIVRNLIASLRGRMSVIISSHILPEIEETCDRVLIINGGRIVASGSPADLRREMFGHTTYRVELAGDTTRLAADLTALDPTLRLSGLGELGPDGFATATLLTEAPEDLGEKLLLGLPARGYRVRSLGHAHPSLEDVFLAATRRSWDARLPDQKPTEGASRAPLPKV